MEGPPPHAGAGVVAEPRTDTRSELNVVREAGDRLPSSLRLKTVFSVFLALLLGTVTIPILLAAGGGPEGEGPGEAWRDQMLAVAALAALTAVMGGLLFLRFYFGPVLRFAESTLRKLRHLTATLEQRVEERTAALSEANQQLRSTVAQNRAIQRQLMEASRRAGMAEVATSVLHNVGNALNSANVSAGVLVDTVHRSRLTSLGKAADLIREHATDWARFVSEDEKGRKLPAYICSLAEAAALERQVLLHELACLQRNIDHIKTIVARQQSQAKATLGVSEQVNVPELLDEVLGDNAAGLERAGAQVERDYQDLPPVDLDRHKLFEIAGNLVSNACEALAAAPGPRPGPSPPCLTVRAAPVGKDRFKIEVIDTGCGIAAANLARIFTFGFTTRVGGHGFGLHASALAAAEMGGSLSGDSPGVGLGARFVLELPCQSGAASRTDRALTAGIRETPKIDQ